MVSPTRSSSRTRPTSDVNGAGRLCNLEPASKLTRDERAAINADHHTN
jgi:hypothetical protein